MKAGERRRLYDLFLERNGLLLDYDPTTYVNPIYRCGHYGRHNCTEWWIGRTRKEAINKACRSLGLKTLPRSMKEWVVWRLVNT